MQLKATLLPWLPVPWGRYVEFVIGRNEMGQFEVGGCFFMAAVSLINVRE